MKTGRTGWTVSCSLLVILHPSTFILAAAALLGSVAAAQEYPSRPIRLIVPFPPGGTADIMPRIFGEKLTAKWGQAVIVDNRPGAAGNIGAELVYRAEPDGYTLLSAPPPPLVINPFLYPKLAFDPARFVTVGIMGAVPNVLLVNPKVPAANVQELIAYARSNPDRLNYASQGSGTTSHLTTEMFKTVAGGLRIAHVPYKGNAQAIVDVIAGQVAMMYDQISTAAPFITSGKLRGLAVTSLKRSPLFPDLPTVDESGVPKFEEVTFNGIVAPAGTPREALMRLHSGIAKAVKIPEQHKRYLERGIELTASVSPEEFASYIKAEFEKKAKLAKEAGIRIE